MKYGARRLGVAIVMASILTACGDRNDATNDTLALSTDSAARTVDSAAGALVGTEYTPEQFMGRLHTMNTTELEVARLGVTRATNAQVKAFAQEVVRDHEKMAQDLTAAGHAAPMGGEPSDLTDDRREAIEELNEKSAGNEFDEVWLERMIELHKDAIDDINEQMERTTTDAAMRDMLEKARTSMQTHLSRAQDLEKQFGV